MKRFNRIITILLCAILLSGMMTLSTFALLNKNTINSPKVSSDDVSISFVEIDGKTASVDLINSVPCRLVVAIYDQDSGKMLASGIKDVDINAANAKVSIDIPSMPEYFLLRAFALDSDMSALCCKYESPLYTRELSGYRMISFFVNENKDGAPAAVPGAVLTSSDGLCDNDGDGKWDDNTVTADENGKAVLYFKQGNHSVSVSAQGYFDSVTNFTVTANGDTVSANLIKNGGDEPESSASGGIGSSDGWIDYKHFNLGSYPQTNVTESMSSVLNSQQLNWKSYRYYSGTGKSTDGQMTPGDYMLYCDVVYGTEKFRGVTFTTYRPSTTGYKTTSHTDYSYQYENGYICGNVYWFKYEPLQWRVINSQTGLVISEIIIDSVPYSDYVKKGSDGEYYNDKGAYSYDWETSSLKAWLNDDFYRTAFTAEEQSVINEDENGNLYVLTESEATNPVYFTSAFPRQAEGSDYSKCQGLSTGSVGAPEWRLRSPGYNSLFTCAVFNDGNLDEQCSAGLTGTGVRPSFKIDMSALGIRPNSSPKQVVARRSVKSVDAPQDTSSLIGTGIFDYSCSGCEAGGDYVLLNVTGYGDGFDLTCDNLEYINQISADSNGNVSGRFIPRNTDSDSTTLLIGKFGGIVSAKLLTVTEEMMETPESKLPDINIRNYKSSITVDYKSKLVFHTDIEAPAGYWIIWSTGDVGSSCTVDRALNGEYKIKADLVRASDNKVIKSSQEEIVKVKTGFFAKIIAFFREIFSDLPVYEDNIKK